MKAEESLLAKAAKIRLLLSDIDGVWTDGGILLHADGSESVRFDVHDGLGLVRLQAAGVSVAVISGREVPAVRRRAEKLGVGEIHLGVADKAAVVREILARAKLGREQVAAIGDDLPDLDLFDAAALRFAPANAVATIRDAADHVTEASGGAGAVREACEWILRALGQPLGRPSPATTVGDDSPW